MAATHAFWLSLFRKDLLRDFSESPVTAVSPGAEGTPLVKGPERRPKWKPRRFRCQRETILHWLRVGFGPFAMASPTTPAEKSNGETQTARISLTAHFLVVGKTP